MQPLRAEIDLNSVGTFAPDPGRCCAGRAGAAAAGSMLTHRAAQGLKAYLPKRTPRPAADRPSLALDHA